MIQSNVHARILQNRLLVVELAFFLKYSGMTQSTVWVDCPVHVHDHRKQVLDQ